MEIAYTVKAQKGKNKEIQLKRTKPNDKSPVNSRRREGA